MIKNRGELILCSNILLTARALIFARQLRFLTTFSLSKVYAQKQSLTYVLFFQFLPALYIQQIFK